MNHGGGAMTGLMVGLVQCPLLQILMELTHGDIIEMEAEVYVVKGMSVPIFLGEDFQLNYELGVVQGVEEGSRITFGGTEFEVKASGVGTTMDQARMRSLATGLTTYANRMDRAKNH